MDLKTLSERINASLGTPKTEGATDHLIDIAYLIGHADGYDECYKELQEELEQTFGEKEVRKFFLMRNLKKRFNG